MALPDVEFFERAGLKAWPGVEVEWDGNWVRRAAACPSSARSKHCTELARCV